jgi:hypothetical protein
VDWWFIRTDASGDTLWTKTFGDKSKKTSDGGFIIVWTGSEDIWLIKTDALGDTLWTKNYSIFDRYFVQDILQTTDGYVLIGSVGGWLDENIWVIKTDANGDTLWAKTYGEGNSERGRKIQETKDGGYIILVEEFCSLPTCGHIADWLVRMDANGDTLWKKETSNVGWKNFNQTDDGGYIITGSEGRDVLLLKIAPDVTSLDENKNVSIVGYQLYQNYPNPFNPTTTIRYQLPQTSRIDLSIYNILGQKLITLAKATRTAGTYSITWNASDYSNGVYFYTLETNNGFVQTRKLVILK